jgi:hypothetical protein
MLIAIAISMPECGGVPPETSDTLLAALARLGMELGITATDDQNREMAKEALRHLAQQRATWLLVYDNVRDPDQLTDLIPTYGARVLITSRFSDWSGWAEEVAVDTLPRAEAIEYLQNRTGRHDETGANVLAEALGCLPLALDHAAAYCRRTQLQFVDYAAKAARLIATVPRGVAYPRSVMATFSLAIEEATKQCADAAILIAYLAFWPRLEIEMLQVRGAVADETQLMEAVIALVEASLVMHTSMPDGTPALTVHSLVTTVARLQTEADGTASIAWDRLLGHFAVLFPELFRQSKLRNLDLTRETDGVIDRLLPLSSLGLEGPLGARLHALVAAVIEERWYCREKLHGNAISDARTYFDKRGEDLPPGLVEYIEELSTIYNQTTAVLRSLIGIWGI